MLHADGFYAHYFLVKFSIIDDTMMESESERCASRVLLRFYGNFTADNDAV